MKNPIILFFCVFAFLFSKAQNPQFQWGKGIGGGSYDDASSVITDVAGNSYITGAFQGNVDFDPGPGVFNLTSSGYRDIFILKLNPSGNFIWAKSIGGSLEDAGYSIQLDASGNILTSGSFGGTVDFDPSASTYTLNSSIYSDAYVLKMDSNGNFIWARNVGGGSSNSGGLSIAVDPLGNSYVTGHFMGTADFDPNSGILNYTSFGGSNDIFILKLDPNGNLLFAEQIGDTQSDFAYSVSVDATGNFYLTGFFMGIVDFDAGVGTYTLSSQGGEDIYIAKFNSSGNLIWAKDLGGPLEDVGFGVVIDATGNSYATGHFRGTVDFDPGIGTFSLSSAGNKDVFISKLDGSGNFAWAKNFGSKMYDEGHALALDNVGNVYIGGTFQDTIDFDPSISVFNAIAVSNDAFFVKFDQNGNFIWAKNIGGSGIDFCLDIALDASNNIYTVGFFNTTIDLDPGPSTYNVNSNGNEDIFILKLSSTVGIYGMGLNDVSCTIYPNPTSSLLNISITNSTQNYSVEVYNSLGTLIFQQNNLDEIDLTNQSNGLYFVKVMSDGVLVGTQKIVKE